MTDQPFLTETRALLDAVNTLDLEGLRGMVDDEYGIVDVDPEGRTIVIDDAAEWTTYMERNFAAMRSVGAALSSRILDYHGDQSDRLGYSVVRFVQRVEFGETVIENRCVATVVWKRNGTGWKEARWHCSPDQV